MPALSKSRRGALERLREVKRRNAIEEEEKRLDAILKRIEERRQRMEDNMEDLFYLEMQNINVFNVSSFYINYDGEFQTRRMSAMLFSELAAESGYLSGEQRKQLFGPEGFINTGFLTEGPLPTFGSWPTARPLSAMEKARLHTATACLQQRISEVDAAGRLHEKPYGFETEQTLARCYAHVRSLMDGPLAEEVDREDLPKDTWVFPFFGLGQKWDESSSRWTKVRPIANEKLRNNLCSPLAEHLVLPGTDTLVDMSFFCLNPTYLDSVNETRGDVLKSLEKGRQQAKAAGNTKLQWRDLESMPRSAAAYDGHSLTKTYMNAIRRLLAAMGIAVAPEKCFTAEYGELIELLGINFLPAASRILVALPEKKVKAILDILFGMFLFDRDIGCPEAYISTVSQRLRSLNALERGNAQAGQLQSLTFDNLNRYSQLFEPIRAMPPDLTRLPLLELREQRTFGMWSITGLRKCSFSSIRKDCLTVSEDQRFVKAMIPSIKSLPVPGEYFYAYIPKDIFFADVFPVTPMELDTVAHKLHTTSHGVRRALALQLRRRCAEIGLRPDPEGRHSKEYLVYRQKVSDLFGWTCNSTMWEEVYSKDIAIHRNANFSMHPAVDRYFTGQQLTTVIKPIQKTLTP
eukprot:g12529.t1